MDNVAERSDATVLTVSYPTRTERIELEPRGDGRTDVVTSIQQRDGTFREAGHEVADTVEIDTTD